MQLTDLVLEYAVLTAHTTQQGRSYLDLDADDEQKLARIFGNDTVFKDRFAQNYYQADAQITRGEAAYFLTQVRIRSQQSLYSKR